MQIFNLTLAENGPIEALTYLDADTMIVSHAQGPEPALMTETLPFDEIWQLPVDFGAVPDIWGDFLFKFNAGERPCSRA